MGWTQKSFDSQNNLQDTLSAYQKAYDEKWKHTQTTHGCFSERNDTCSRIAPGRSSGGVPEEAIVIIGDHSSMRVTTLEELPGDKM
jgi:hypothetical protein